MALQKLYFSGVASRREFELLQRAGVKRIMVDPFDLKNVPADWDGEVLLDSGAYRALTQPRKALSVAQLVDFVMAHRQRLAGVVARLKTPSHEHLQQSIYHVYAHLEIQN